MNTFQISFMHKQESILTHDILNNNGPRSLMLLRVEFLLKTDSGYPRDAEVTLFTMAIDWLLLRIY